MWVIVGVCERESDNYSFTYKINNFTLAGDNYVGHLNKPAPGDNNQELRFDNPTAAFRSKSTLELIRAFTIFKLCSYDVLINYQPQVVLIDF